ncbi:hypothetical protein G6F16_014122 [Rhizopus arrhizus]|nr:hypothetical protein G6F21_014282 [Rhizopus arrhizus]KAG0849057.1 hypothetical protein G6F16_014122 [Rhizopus arrhizus]KAG0849963.1 hypothetical protein G6F15_014185 [Rhizopus arrhizus]KAG1139917.1 hypothetical protein G6F36_015892 [Rhizopus arrhizus]
MATPAPYKAAALKGKKTAPPAHKPPTTRPRKVLSTRQLQVVARTFTPVSGTHGYQYIYLPCRFRESISNARAKLAKLRLENSRILHLPCFDYTQQGRYQASGRVQPSRSY